MTPLEFIYACEGIKLKWRRDVLVQAKMTAALLQPHMKKGRSPNLKKMYKYLLGEPGPIKRIKSGETAQKMRSLLNSKSGTDRMKEAKERRRRLEKILIAHELKKTQNG